MMNRTPRTAEARCNIVTALLAIEEYNEGDDPIERLERALKAVAAAAEQLRFEFDELRQDGHPSMRLVHT